MPTKFHQTLFLARSAESADLYLSRQTGAVKALTLGAFLASEELSTSAPMDAMIGKMVLQRAVESLELDHFNYLPQAESALGELYTHILACKRNRVGLEAFGYDPKKLDELQRILEAYEVLKNAMGLRDSADALLEAVEALRTTRYFDRYDTVLIDVFEEEGVRFYGSALEKEALEIIAALPQARRVEAETRAQNPIATFTPQPSRFDEALFAIKAARRLMEEGVADTDIAIVAGNLGNYRRVLESYAPQYGMQLRFSSGTPLLQSPLLGRYRTAKSFEGFRETLAVQLRKDLEDGLIDDVALAGIKNEFTQIQRLHQRCVKFAEEAKKLFGTAPDFKETLRKLAEETYVPPLTEDAGIWVSEPNQMSLRTFEHVLFIGTDLSQFPPKTKGNFLSTPEQRERYLGVDNTYRLSSYYYERMRRNSTNLHIATARNEGKKKLFVSPIISELPSTPFSGYEYEGEREVLLAHKRYAQEERFEGYIESILSSEYGNYDGAASAHRFESGVLSASSLNEYAKCPLRYLLSYQYGAEPLEIERDDDALEASDIGIIFHSIAERFAKDVKSCTIVLGEEPTMEVKEHLRAIAENVHRDYLQKQIIEKGKTPNIFHEIVLADLLKGMFEDHHDRGLLIRFLEYVYASGKLEHFEKSEQRFLLDSDFKITADKEAAMIKGFIDRIDCDREGKILSVIDYKTGKYDKNKENRLLDEMATFRQFQLPLYLLYASQAYRDYAIDAYLLAMRNGKGTKDYAHMSTDEANGLLFDEAYMEGLKQRIRQIKAGIGVGQFAMSPSEANCEYCPHERICHKSILPHKGAKNELSGADDEQ